MKRVLAMVLVVVMLLMTLPAMSVSAAGISWPAIGENVTIGGKAFEYIGIMGENFDCIDITHYDDVGTPYAGKFGVGYFTWDGEDTLVLNNTTGNFEEQYSVVNIEGLTVDIVLEGEN
ncbi:MAG: hypothetical protein IJN82_06810, partial [Clostridia bacterium]|nr:hypothetical protein [Clostridia bacterium]